MSRIMKQQRRYGSEWYLENDEGDVAWVAPMVKEYIERLEGENEKLREFLQDTLMDADDYAKKYGISPSFTDITEHLDTRMRELGIEG